MFDATDFLYEFDHSSYSIINYIIIIYIVVIYIIITCPLNMIYIYIYIFERSLNKINSSMQAKKKSQQR